MSRTEETKKEKIGSRSAATVSTSVSELGTQPSKYSVKHSVQSSREVGWEESSNSCRPVWARERERVEDPDSVSSVSSKLRFRDGLGEERTALNLNELEFHFKYLISVLCCFRGVVVIT